MGIMDNILFVVNCDFSEHDSLFDLKRLIESIKENLSMIKPSPQIYSISALYNLFKAQPSLLSQKDRLRLGKRNRTCVIFRRWNKAIWNFLLWQIESGKLCAFVKKSSWTSSCHFIRYQALGFRKSKYVNQRCRQRRWNCVSYQKTSNEDKSNKISDKKHSWRLDATD